MTNKYYSAYAKLMLRQLGLLPNIETLFSPFGFYSKLFYASGLSFKFATVDLASANPGQIYLYNPGTDPNTILRQSLQNAYNDLNNAIIGLGSNFPQTQLSIIFVNGDFRLVAANYFLPRNCYLVGYNEFGGAWRNNSLTSFANSIIRFENGGVINLTTTFVNYITRESFDVYGCSFICSSPLEMNLSPTSDIYINDSYLFSNFGSLFLINYGFTPVNRFKISYSELSCAGNNSTLFRTFSTLPILVMFKVYVFRTSVWAETIYEGRDIFTFDMLDASNFHESENSLSNMKAVSNNGNEKAIINFVSGYKFPYNEKKFNKFLIWDEVAEIISNSSLSLSNLTICSDYVMKPTDNIIYVCNSKPITITLPSNLDFNNTGCSVSNIGNGKQYTIVKTYKLNNVLVTSELPIGKSNSLVIPAHILSVKISLNSTKTMWIITEISPYLC